MKRKKSARPKRTLKAQVKKHAIKKKKLPLTKSSKQRKIFSIRKAPSQKVKKIQLKSSQQEITHAKFYTGFESQGETPRYVSTELPDGYGENKIVAQVRDPWWIHTYWEIRSSTIEEIRNHLTRSFQEAAPILRVYDISSIDFNGTNAHRYFDIEIRLDARNWYIEVGAPGRSWCVDIGFRLRNGSFFMMARSNCVTTPLDGPSWITDEEWMIPDDKFARLYGMGLGFGPSSQLKKVKKGYIGSPGLFSITSPSRKPKNGKRQRNFRVSVNTELIVRGTTEPDAHVTVRAEPIQLNSDETSQLRLSLPDGKQTVPVEVRSSDGQEHQAVTPIVLKETRQGIF